MDAIKNITIGHTERLYKPVGYTMLANLVNIIPLPLHRGGAHHLRRIRRQWTFARHGKAVEHFRHIGRLYAGDALAERASYRANFRGAYEMSASGRIALAEHLRKLSLGFLSRATPAIFRPCSLPISQWPRRAFPTICPN